MSDTFESNINASIGLLDPKNREVAVEILLLAGLEHEIHLGVILPPFGHAKV